MGRIQRIICIVLIILSVSFISSCSEKKEYVKEDVYAESNEQLTKLEENLYKNNNNEVVESETEIISQISNESKELQLGDIMITLKKNGSVEIRAILEKEGLSDFLGIDILDLTQQQTIDYILEFYSNQGDYITIECECYPNNEWYIFITLDKEYSEETIYYGNTTIDEHTDKYPEHAMKRMAGEYGDFSYYSEEYRNAEKHSSNNMIIYELDIADIFETIGIKRIICELPYNIERLNISNFNVREDNVVVFTDLDELISKDYLIFLCLDEK